MILWAELEISKLVIIGGNGSFNALNQFYVDFEVPFAGIAATIVPALITASEWISLSI
ncbi:MAG: 6-phosphofructokinase [Akkermansiaceae bacterium]